MNLAPLNKIKSKNKNKIKNSKLNILTVCRLEKQKNLECLLKALTIVKKK